MSNDRVKKLRAKNLELGRKRTEMYLTDAEREKVKLYIERLRGKTCQK